MREHTRRFGRIERQLAGIIITEADEGVRVDQLTECIERIERRLSPVAVLAEVRRLGLRTPAEAAAVIRADRDRR